MATGDQSASETNALSTHRASFSYTTTQNRLGVAAQ